MKKILLALVTLVAITTIISFVTACGDDDNSAPSDAGADTDTDTDADTDTDIGGTVLLRAVAADGPCVAGSVYYLSELDNSTPGLQIVSTVSGVTNARGEIVGEELKENTPYDLRVHCLDFNEILGDTADGEVILNKFFVTGESGEGDAGADSDAQYGNVNDISEFIYRNTRTAYENSAERTHVAYAIINQTAFHNLIPQLPFIIPQDGWLDCDPDTLSIVDGSSPCNDILLGVELPFRFNAVTKATGSETSLLLENLEKVMNDYEDGILDSDGADVIADVNETAPFIDVVTAQNNLATHLASVGGTAPNANNVLDMDNDETPNSSDPDIDGDGYVNESDVAPYDFTVGGATEAESVYIPGDGLMWQRFAPDATYIWVDASTYCADLVMDTKDDWRMPTISELRTLITGCASTETGGVCGVTDECVASGGCWDSDCYSCETTGCYWPQAFGEEDCSWLWFFSATEISDVSGRAWSVAFDSAAIGQTDTATLSKIRCVRDDV